MRWQSSIWWPLMAAISGTVQPASASRTMAVRRRSWNRTPSTPAARMMRLNTWRK